MECVDSITKCQSKALWFSVYECPWCHKKHTLCFTCKRPICSTCSKPRCDRRVNKMWERLPTNVKYLHLTFTLPEELRDFRIKYRKHWVLDILFQQITALLINFFKEKFHCKPWIFSIIHTFWSAVNRNPHIHCIVTLWGIKQTEKWPERIDIEGKYIPYKCLKKTWRACIAKQCRLSLKEHDPSNYESRNNVIETLFRKSWYVTVSEPIIDVVHVMSYVTRYMYRPPLSMSNIVWLTDTWDPKTSTIRIKYFHKKPREERIVEYTLFEFMGILARQIPDKYFRTVRYSWIFAPKGREKRVLFIRWLSTSNRSSYTKSLPKRPKTYQQRIQQAFNHNPLHCNSCNLQFRLVSITFWSKKNNCFVEKLFDSS